MSNQFDQEDQDMINLLQANPSTLTADARRRIWKQALQNTPPRRDLQWVGRLPFALAGLGLVLFVFVLTVRPLLSNPSLAATATQTATPTVSPSDNITSQYMVMHTTRDDIQEYTFVWYQAPDLYRSETYSTEYSPLPDRANISVLFRNSLLQNQIAKLPQDVSPEKYRLTGMGLMDKDRYWNLYGGDVTLFKPVLNNVTFRQYLLAREQATGHGQEALNGLLERYTTRSGTAKLIGEETLLGRKAWIIDGYNTFSYSTSSQHQRLWIDQENFFRLKTTNYDSKSDQATEITEIVQLEVNTAVPASIFRLDIPVEAWRDAFGRRNSATLDSLWGFYLPDVPFTLYTINLTDVGLAGEFLFATPEYDPLENKVTGKAFSASDPFGKAVIQIEESPATNPLAVADGKGYSPTGDSISTEERAIYVSDSNHIFDWVTNGTHIRITADASALNAAEFQVLARLLRYVPPTVDPLAYMGIWKNIALSSNFRVFAPGYNQWVKFDETGKIQESSIGSPINFTNLIAGQPIQSTINGIQQPFYFANKPGIAVIMTEGKFSIDYSSWERVIKFNESDLWYKAEGNRQMLVSVKGGTTIRFEALTGEVSKDDLTTLSSQMQQVPLPETK